MLVDKSLEFCDNLALNTGAAGSYQLGDVVDLWAGVDAQNTTRDLGEAYKPSYLYLGVSTAATSGGAATLSLALVSDTATNLTTAPTTHYATPAIAVATLAAGYRIAAVQLPSGDYKRYLGIVQTTGTAAFTAGKVDAFITDNPGRWKSYFESVNI